MNRHMRIPTLLLVASLWLVIAGCAPASSSSDVVGESPIVTFVSGLLRQALSDAGFDVSQLSFGLPVAAGPDTSKPTQPPTTASQRSAAVTSPKPTSTPTTTTLTTTVRRQAAVVTPTTVPAGTSPPVTVAAWSGTRQAS